jgi:putative SOS response-associated peptidase YedK
MCSRYSLTSPHEAVRSYFSARNAIAFPPRYNIAPTQPVVIVQPDPIAPAGGRALTLVRWGLLPPWVKDPSAFATLINARSETAHEKPSFRGAMRHKRCLVPADGFYEWVGGRGHKRPYLVRRRDRAPMAFAGLFEEWLGADGSELATMAILTVAANATVAAIHDRMPAILAPAAFDAWLDVRGTGVPNATALLKPAAEDLLEIVEVSQKLNNSRNEGPELQEVVRTTLI